MASNIERHHCENGVDEFTLTTYLDDQGSMIDDTDRLLLQETRDLILQEPKSVLSNSCFTVLGKRVRVQFYSGDETNECCVHLDGSDKPKGHWREHHGDTSGSSDEDAGHSSDEETEKVAKPAIQWDKLNVAIIPSDQLEKEKKISSGRFDGKMKGKRVFVRQLMTIDNFSLFEREVTILRDLNHENVIKLFGVCLEPLCIVSEFMENGTFLDFLRTNKKLALMDGIAMACQIAKGVAYIGSKGYVHRDVASRNVLIGQNNVCKMADFKMAGKLDKNGIYEMSGEDRIPIKWTAKEVLLEFKCTVKSDVWSFGILLSEIVSKGQTPYPGMTNAEVQKFVVGGYHMPRPEKCPRKLYDVMLGCWETDPADRPTFQKLQRDLAALKV